MPAVAHCSSELDRAVSRVSQASSCRASLASEELRSRGNLAIVVLAETTIVEVEASVYGHVGKVCSSAHTSKLAIRKLPLSCNNRGVIIVKGASGNGLVPSIVRTGSAALNAVHGSVVTRNPPGVLQGELIDAAGADVVLRVAS